MRERQDEALQGSIGGAVGPAMKLLINEVDDRWLAWVDGEHRHGDVYEVDGAWEADVTIDRADLQEFYVCRRFLTRDAAIAWASAFILRDRASVEDWEQYEWRNTTVATVQSWAFGAENTPAVARVIRTRAKTWAAWVHEAPPGCPQIDVELGTHATLAIAQATVEAYVAAKKSKAAPAPAPKKAAKKPAPNKGKLEKALSVLRDPSGDGSTKVTLTTPDSESIDLSDVEKASKNPRLRELLELEKDARGAVDDLDAEHRLELQDGYVQAALIPAYFAGALGDREVYRTTEELFVPLDDDARLDSAREAATALFAQRRLEDLKKVLAGDLKALVDLYEARVAKLLREVDDGRSLRPVPVIHVRTEDGLRADVVRGDTGEAIRTRDLTADEKQGQLKIA